MDDLLLRVVPYEIGGEVNTGKFRLRMTRRHGDDEALQVATDDPVEGLCHEGVVRARYEGWPDTLDEGQEMIPGLFEPLGLLKLLGKLKEPAPLGLR